MREYRGSEIRNIAVVGHGASGKTSLVDALAFVSGSSKRHGSIGDGTTLTDSAPEEVERGYSINLGCAFAEWMDTKINLIDTPGFLDFQGDAIAGLAAADGALCVIGATSGVEVGTERMFQRGGLPRRPGALRRHDDGQGERRLRRDLPADQVAPHEQGDPDRGARRRGTGLPRHRQPVRQEGARLRARHEDRRVRGDRRPARGAAAVRPLLRGADRDDRRDGRLPARALPRRRRDRTRRGDPRDEGRDEADGAVPALLRLVHAQLRHARRALHDRRADAERVRDGGDPRLRRRRGRPHGRDPRQRRRAVRRARVQDAERAARRRRERLPHPLRLRRQRRRGVQRDARRRREAQPSRPSRRAATASRSRASTPATSAASPSCATRTRTTRSPRARIRCACRRSPSPSRSCRWRSRR